MKRVVILTPMAEESPRPPDFKLDSSGRAQSATPTAKSATRHRVPQLLRTASKKILTRSRRDAAVALVSVVILLAVVGLIGFRHNLDWGNVPTWFAGGFAVIAASISYKSYRVARGNHEIAQEAFNVSQRSYAISEQSHQATRAAIDDGFAAQARLIVTDYEEYPGGYFLVVANFSDSIIFDVDLEVFENEHGPGGMERVLREFDDENEVYEQYEDQRVLPGETSRSQSYTNLSTPFQYVTTFTDARGIRWERRMDEQPSRILPTS